MHPVRKRSALVAIHEVFQPLLDTEANEIWIPWEYLQKSTSGDLFLGKWGRAGLAELGLVLIDHDAVDEVFVSRGEESTKAIGIRILLPFLRGPPDEHLRVVLDQLAIGYSQLDVPKMRDVGYGIQQVRNLGGQTGQHLKLGSFNWRPASTARIIHIPSQRTGPCYGTSPRQPASGGLLSAWIALRGFPSHSNPEAGVLDLASSHPEASKVLLRLSTVSLLPGGTRALVSNPCLMWG